MIEHRNLRQLEQAYLHAHFSAVICASGDGLNRLLADEVYDPRGVYQIHRGVVTRIDQITTPTPPRV